MEWGFVERMPLISRILCSTFTFPNLVSTLGHFYAREIKELNVPPVRLHQTQFAQRYRTRQVSSKTEGTIVETREVG